MQVTGLVFVVMLIPLFAIVGGIALEMVKTRARSRETELRLKFEHQQTATGSSDKRVEVLQAELSQLRDTTTQFAMSLDHSLKRIEQRLDHLERRSNESATTQVDGPAQSSLADAPSVSVQGVGTR